MTENQKLQEENKPDKKGKKFSKRPVDPRYLKTLQVLQEKFPEAFPASEARILKIGIHKEIKQHTEINGKDIFMFLRKYCNLYTDNYNYRSPTTIITEKLASKI